MIMFGHTSYLHISTEMYFTQQAITSKLPCDLLRLIQSFHPVKRQKIDWDLWWMDFSVSSDKRSKVERSRAEQ